MASSLMIMSDPSHSSLVTRSTCSSSRPVIGRRSGAATVDFSAYLLSASPPGFELSPGVFGCGLPPSERFSSGGFHVEDSSVDVDWNWSPRPSAWSNCRLQSDGVSSSSTEVSPTSSSRSSLSRSRQSSGGSGGLTKKVSFADDLGMLLEQIRVFNESSDTPPNISPKVLRRHASADNLLAAASLSKVETTQSRPMRHSSSMPVLHLDMFVPRLVPNFPMPAADRSSYLERIELAYVSLESVRVLPVESRPGNGCVSPPVVDRLVGSIGVRNVAFEKSVTVRCTFDGWASFVNVRGVYSRSERAVRTSGNLQPLSGLEFDVFDFSVNLPVRWRTGRGQRPRVELAVRYDVDGKTYWDNNDGRNYELVGTAETPSPSTLPTSVDSHDDQVKPCWTEFSGWNDVDVSCPYW